MMRDYIVNEAQSRSSHRSFAALRQLVRNWQSRKTFTKLHLLDDHQLADIGLTRAHLRQLNALPLSVDPIWEADRLRLVASHSKQASGRQINSTGNT